MKSEIIKNLDKRKIIALMISFCAIVLVVYYFFFLGPSFLKCKVLFFKAKDLKTKIREAELVIKETPIFKTEIDKLKLRENSYSGKLPKEEEFPAILESLSEMARNTGVKIIKILPVRDSFLAEDKSESLYIKKGIGIDAQCGYHQLGTFIAELENAERFMKVSDIKIQAGEADPGQHSVQLMIMTFILKED